METNSKDSTITPLRGQQPTAAAGRQISKSSKLDDVCYDIRGPVLAEANRLEEEGHRIFKLNIGNPAPWGFEAPEEILRGLTVKIVRSLPCQI